jgi:hypothetical protein
VRISENVRSSFNQDGAVLMDIHGGAMLVLNRIGSIIWQQLGDDRSSVEIAEYLATEFSIPREHALADVNEFVQQLEARQLVQSFEANNTRMNLRRSVWGLVRNLFERRSPNAVQDRASK